MKAKILTGILLTIGLIASIGITEAHGNENKSGHTMIESVEGETSVDMPMMDEMMTGMQEETIKEMQEMMNNEEFRNEMVEHMKNCPVYDSKLLSDKKT